MSLFAGCSPEEPAPDATPTAGPALPPPAGMPVKGQAEAGKPGTTEPKKETATANDMSKKTDVPKVETPKAEPPKTVTPKK